MHPFSRTRVFRDSCRGLVVVSRFSRSRSKNRPLFAVTPSERSWPTRRDIGSSTDRPHFGVGDRTGGDGRVDWPADPGCRAAGSASEIDPERPPACSNGLDDDGDGVSDWPADDGCESAAGSREDGRVLADCSGGVDNDGDGDVDLADVGCTDAADTDEGAGPVNPACANGRDDDGDGDVDWPADDGCGARGDVCEQPGFGLCDDECRDLENDPDNCGVCGVQCGGDVECIRGGCGGIRPQVARCGLSGIDVNLFVRGPLLPHVREVVESCAPGEGTQAMLVPRRGAPEVVQNAAAVTEYVRGGGIVITEFNVSDEIFNAILSPS